MKNIGLLLFAIVLLISCSTEKRLYRPGWYTGHAHGKSIPQEKAATTDASIAADEKIAAAPDTTPARDTSAVSATAVTAPGSSPSTTARPASVSASQPAPAPGDKPMSYEEARRRMAEKGCTPNSFANAIYHLGIASIVLSFLGAGILLSLVTLILSIFATNAVIAEGKCVDENLAIIRKGKRMAVLGLIIFMIMAVLTLLLLFLLLSLVNVH